MVYDAVCTLTWHMVYGTASALFPCLLFTLHICVCISTYACMWYMSYDALCAHSYDLWYVLYDVVCTFIWRMAYGKASALLHIHVCMHTCIYVFMYARVHVCTMYACMHV